MQRRRPLRAGSIVRGAVVAIFLIALFCAGTVAGIVAAYSRNLPDISRMADYQPARSTRIFARDGSLLASVYKENRVWTSISGIPPIVREAFIANEDHNFYAHHGIDFGGVIRAAFADFTHQEFQGASTITQQLARTLFLTNEKSISRKIQEALLAVEIERYYTKDEILERYLNLIYLGSGAYGVDAAAHTYFGEGVSRLSIGQAAMLAGVVAAPSDYSPFENFNLAKERQRHVLDRMVESGYVTADGADAAYAAPLGLVAPRKPGLQGYSSPYFTTYVIAQLENSFGNQALQEGGLQVYTTVDPRLERVAQEAIDWGVQSAQAEGINAHQAAIVVIRPLTGEIVAMVGGTHFSLTNQFNRAWQAHRQPGSSFKAYVYTAAIDSGMTPDTVMSDSPVSYDEGGGVKWSPEDDDFSYMGAITLRQALAYSRNIVAVKVADQIGLDRVIDYAHRMGITAQLEPDLSMPLGSNVVTVLDQASGYQTLANSGVHIEPVSVRLVQDSIGSNILDNRYPRASDVVSAATAYTVTSMLEDVIRYGTGTNANIGRPAAGKTGTTTSFRDAWFVGYTPDLVAAVWIGNDDYSRMNESYGGNIPARIWARFMSHALEKVAKHDFAVPTELAHAAVCGGANNVDYANGTQSPMPCVYRTPRAFVPVAISKPTIAPTTAATILPVATAPPTLIPAAAPAVAPSMPIPEASPRRQRASRTHQ